MNLREGFKRIYAVFAVGICLWAGVDLFAQRPTGERLADRFTTDIARAEAKMMGHVIRDYREENFLRDVHGTYSMTQALGSACAKTKPKTAELFAACDEYRLAKEKLPGEIAWHITQTLGLVALLAAVLYLVWRCLDWIFQGFAAAPGQPPSA